MPDRSRLVRSALIVLVLTSAVSVSAAAQKAAPRADRPVWPDEGARTWTPRPTESAITPNDLRTRLYQIADDSMEGRDIGSRGDYKATAYIADVFHRLGLRPAGEKETYFQDLPYGAFALQGAAPRLTVGRTTLSAGARWIPLAPSGASATGGTAALRGAPVVFAGHFGDTVTLDPARFRGKVAVFVGGPRVPESQGGGAPVLRCDSVPDRFGADAPRGRSRGECSGAARPTSSWGPGAARCISSA